MLDSIRLALLFGVFWLIWRTAQRVQGGLFLDNIPGPPSQSFIKGNLGQLFDRHGWHFQHELCEKFGSVVRINGRFGSKRLFVFDPLALSSIVVKEQHIYEIDDETLVSEHLMLGDGLFATTGERHRKQRKMLTPVFSIHNIREMVPVLLQVTYGLRDALASRVSGGTTEVDILDWMSRVSLELIGQTGLGYSFNPFRSDSADSYATALKALIPTLFPLRFVRPLLPLCMKLGTPAFRRRVIDFIPMSHLQRAREISDILACHSRQIYEEKRLALEMGNEAVLRQVGEGKDIMSRLLQANLAAEDEDKLPEEELLGQMSTFIAAGVETTSGALTRVIQLLSERPEVQGRLRDELLTIHRADGDVPYDQLLELPYLDAIYRESLRLYPPVPLVTRTARKDTMLPLSSPIRGVDGTLVHRIPVQKGTDVIVGILASNRNRNVWGPDAAEWKPERWLSSLPEAVSSAHIPGVYSHLMTFMGGSRACIAFKLSEIEIKIVLAILLTTFTFAPADKEIVWNVGATQYPTVGRNGAKLEMPIRISPWTR